MGAIQKIRNQSTLLVVTIAIGLLCFIVPWSEITSFVNMKKDKAFEVNGEVVKTKQYADQIALEQEIQEASYGNLNETQINQLRENVYQYMVNEIIIDEQAEKIGLGITEEELKSLVFNVTPDSYLNYIPFFLDRQTGRFSYEALNSFLEFVNQPLSNNAQTRAQQQQYRALWNFIENRIQTNALQSKYSSMLMRGIVVNNVEVQNYKNDNTPESTIAFVKVDNSYINDNEIEVSQEEIKKLYNERSKNIFLSKYPIRTLSYFIREITPSRADYDATYEEALQVTQELEEATHDIAAVVNDYSTTKYINAFVNINNIPNKDVKNFVTTSSVGDVKGPVEEHRAYTIYKYVAKTVSPDSITVQFLPLANMPAFDNATIQFADSLIAVVKGGKNFSTLIEELYPGNPNFLQTQKITEEMLATVVDDASQFFNAPTGSVHQMNIQMTATLMKIVEKGKPVEKAKVAVVTLPVEISETTFNLADNEINSFISNVNKDIVNFDKAALEKGYDVKEDVMIQPNNIALANIPGTRSIIRWAFNDEKSNKEINRFDLPEARIVTLVTGETKEGYLTVANKQVNEALKQELILQKKLAKITNLINEHKGSELDQLAEKFSTNIDISKFVTFNTPSVDYPLNVWSKVGKLGGESAPMTGTDAVYVMNLIEQQEKTSTQDDAQIKNMIIGNSGLMSERGMFLFQILDNKTQVEDNRITFF